MIKTRPHIFNPNFVQVSIFVAANPTEFIRILGLHVRCIQLTLLLDMDVFFHVFLYGYHWYLAASLKGKHHKSGHFPWLFSNGENDDHPWLKTGRFPPTLMTIPFRASRINRPPRRSNSWHLAKSSWTAAAAVGHGGAMRCLTFCSHSQHK